jgi:hypothetical protein
MQVYDDRFQAESGWSCNWHANSPTLAVATSKLDIYQILCVQFELLMMGGETT